MARDINNLEQRIQSLIKRIQELEQRKLTSTLMADVQRYTDAIKRMEDRLQSYRDQLNNMEAENSRQADSLLEKLKLQIDSRVKNLRVLQNTKRLNQSQSIDINNALYEELLLKRKIQDIYDDTTISHYERIKLMQDEARKLNSLAATYRTISDSIRETDREHDQSVQDSINKRKAYLNLKRGSTRRTENILGDSIANLLPSSISRYVGRILNLVPKKLIPHLRKFFRTFNKAAFGIGIGAEIFKIGFEGAMKRQDYFKEIQREEGLTNKQLLAVRDTMEDLVGLGSSWYNTLENSKKSRQELSEEFGYNIASSAELLNSQNKLKSVYGLTAEESSKLLETNMINGEHQDHALQNMVSIVTQYSKATGYGFKLQKVMKQVSNASYELRSIFKNNNALMASMAARAEMMGTNLTDVQQSMRGMVDLENSITSEVELKALTGNNMNLDAARYYSLNNMMPEFMKELQKVIPSLEEYNKLDIVTKDAYAKALSMNGEQLAKMVNKMELMKRLNITDYSELSEQMSSSNSKFSELLKSGDAQAQAVMKDMEESTVSEKLLKSQDLLTNAIRQLSGIIMAIGGAVVGASIGFALGGPLGALAGGLLGGGAAYAGTTMFDLNDGAIDPSGGLIVSKPKGGIIAQVDPDDNIVATTNPIKKTSEQNDTVINNNLSKVENLLQQLLDKVSQPTYININGTVVRELLNQQNLIKTYVAGMGNSYGVSDKTF